MRDLSHFVSFVSQYISNYCMTPSLRNFDKSCNLKFGEERKETVADILSLSESNPNK